MRASICRSITSHIFDLWPSGRICPLRSPTHPPTSPHVTNCPPPQTPVDPYALLEWVNPGTQHAIREAIREDTQFMFDRGAVLLLLREGDELDVAFTFPGPQFLNTVLDALTKCQDQSTGLFPTIFIPLAFP